VKAPKADKEPTLPFSDEEIARVLGALETKYLEAHPFSNELTKKKIRAFILVMLYSGIMISDCVLLRKERINDGKRQFRHRLFRGEGDKFLRLGRRDALKNEVSLQNLLPTLPATGPFRPKGLGGRLSPMRAVRRCGLPCHGVVSPDFYFVILSDSWQRTANPGCAGLDFEQF
jgi:integrase